MRRRLLRLIAQRSFRFAPVVFVILILLTALSISGMRRIQIDAGRSEILPSPIGATYEIAVPDLYLEQFLREFLFVFGMSLVLTVFLIVRTFRKAESAAFVLLPPTLGTCWALGMAYLFSKAQGLNLAIEGEQDVVRLTGISAGVLLVIFGVGLSYSIQLYHRFTLELYRHENFYRALTVAYVEAGRGVLASAMVAALLFFSVLLTSFSGIQELGVIAAASTICQLTACMLTVPALAALKHWVGRGDVRPVPLRRFNLGFIWSAGCHAPRATLGALLFLTVVLAVRIGPEGIQSLEIGIHPRFASMTDYLFRPVDDEAVAVGGDAFASPPSPGDARRDARVTGQLRYDLALLALIGPLSILAALLLHFRSLRRTLLCFVPILAQVVWVMGAMALLGIELHLLMLVALPLVIALSLDPCIQLVQYVMIEGPGDVAEAARSAGGAAGLAAACIALLYGTLALTSFEGLRDLGLVVLLGSGASVLGTLMLLPALLTLWGGDQPLRSIFVRGKLPLS